MALATPESYNAMLDAAKAGGYAFPAINITSSSSITAAIQGFAEAESDGIIQVSVGGGQYASGSTIKDPVVGSLALAAYAREVADSYGVTVALHTDHCHAQYV
ncbi:MAG: class II fructose-bisphosphate aldolase, partial [Demequinaceae bacterium]|nr:class II fructose-bisphosphate aldolase [Demequinaceae bacterium]